LSKTDRKPCRMEPSYKTGGGNTMLHKLDQRHPKADNVVPKPKPSTAMKRAKRDPIGLLLCVGFGNWRT